MKIKYFRWFLVVYAAFNLACLAVFGLSFHPAVLRWLYSFTSGTTSILFLRLACLFSIALFLGLLLFRHQIEQLICRFLDDVKRVNEQYPAQTIHFDTQVLNRCLMAVLIVFGLIAVSLAVLDTHAYRLFIKEDGIVEYASAIAWLLAAICLTIALYLERRMMRYKRIFYFALILFFIVCAGEEISWGQRLFGWTPIQSIQAINKQHELNLHDIGSISIYENTFFLITVLFFFVIPWVLKKYPQVNSYLRHYNTPVFNPFIRNIFLVSLIIWIIVGVRFGTLGFSPLSLFGYYTQMDDEIFEFMAAYSFFAFALLDLAYRFRERRARAGQAAGDQAASLQERV